MEKRKTISVMIPCYNEAENARAIYEAVIGEMESHCPGYAYEILFIDNKSVDGTRDIIEEICAQDRRVKAIFNCKNFGQFNSPYYGLLQTTGDCTITICADFQDPVELIPRFVRAWEDGYKIVIGKKTRSRENPVLYFLRGCYYKLIRRMSTVEMIEQFTGFGLYDRSFIETLRLTPENAVFPWRSWGRTGARSSTNSPSAGRGRPTTTSTRCLTRLCSASPAIRRWGCAWRSLWASAWR